MSDIGKFPARTGNQTSGPKQSGPAWPPVFKPVQSSSAQRSTAHQPPLMPPPPVYRPHTATTQLAPRPASGAPPVYRPSMAVAAAPAVYHPHAPATQSKPQGAPFRPVVQRFSSNVIQRDITVRNVDYNPVAAVEERYRHGIVNQGAFNTSLHQAINGSAAFDVRMKGARATAVIAAITGVGHDFEGQDVDTLVTAISTGIRGEYSRVGFPIAGGTALANTLTGMVRDSLVANIGEDWAIAMDHGEETGFDSIAALAAMSRQKGVPSHIAAGSLPGPIRDRVNPVLEDIRAERLRWGAATITRDFLINHSRNFASSILARQRGKHYQGNHTNLSGWLPARVTPVDRVTAGCEAFWQNASPRLTRKLKSVDPDAALADVNVGGVIHPNIFRAEYTRLWAAHIAPLIFDDVVKLSAMAALCQGVSAYIEFNMGGSVSRLLYDPVAGRVYISAHYKWRNGYNPFFEVTGFPAL